MHYPNLEWERYKWTSEKGTDFELIREIVMNGYEEFEEEAS